jgi:GNAT superfamily N-acetyltransferase
MVIRHISNLDRWSATLNQLDEKLFGDICFKQNSEWWIAFDGERPIAFAGLHLYQQPRVAFLCRVGVLPTHRGHGLQRRFITVREQHARRQGFERVVTYTERNNYASANNLIRCGYKLYHPRNEFGLKNALYFEKSL